MLPGGRGGWARLNHHRYRDHHSLDADGRALTNGLGCEALMKTLRVLLKSLPDPKGVEILEVSNAPEEARG
jgi:hypothetical protein